MNIPTALTPANRIVFITLTAIILVGLVMIWLAPLPDDLKYILLSLGGAGILYNAFVAQRLFHRARVWRVIIPIGNTLFISVACFLLGEIVPLIVTIYLVAIASVAMRNSWRAALWSAVLSASALVGLNALGKFPFPVLDLFVLIGVLFCIAILTSVLANAAQHHTYALEDAINAHQRGHRELDAERAVTHAVSRTLALDQVLDLALEQSLAVLHLDGGAIFLADDAQTTLTLAAWKNLAPEVRAHLNTYRFGEGITGTAAQERRVIFVANVQQDARVRPPMRAFDVVHAQVSAPLVVRRRVVGVMSLIAASPRALSPEDIALVRAIGASVAVAIDHARVFETLEQRVTERTAELAALNRITHVITQSLDLNAILDTVVSELQTTLQAEKAWARIFDPEKQTLVMQAWKSTREFNMHLPVLNFGEGISGLVARDRQARAVNVADSELTNRAQWLADGLLSVAGAPMLVEDQLVGVLGVASAHRDRYGENELRWLSAISNAAAIAIKNAQLFESRERRATQLTTLREIDHALSSLLNLTPMLETMLILVAHIVPHDSAAVMLLQDSRLKSVAARGAHAEQLRGFDLDISHNAIFQQMERERAPIILNDLPNDPRWVPERNTTSSRAWLGAPLIARCELIGQIGLFSDTPHAFTREHSDLLLAFANHAAITIANTQLRAELREQARRDSLTGALNHGAFIAELYALGIEHQNKPNPFALIMLDLDNYKRYNDMYGHVVGDQVLSVTVQAIRAHIHHTDLVGRWGGEEFGIALPGADLARAQGVAARIRATLAETEIRDAQGRQIPAPTASQGIAAIPATACSVDEVIDQADRALYRAKARGRDQVALANE